MNGDKVTKGRKFWAYVISQFLTTAVTVILIFTAKPDEIVSLGQVYIGFQTVLTGGYIGFNVYQKKVNNGKGT